MIEPEYMILQNNLMSLHTDVYYWVMKLKTFMEADKAILWLSTPNTAFNNIVPFDLIKNGKSEELSKMILEVGEKAFS